MVLYKTRPGIVLAEMCGEYLLVAAKQAREFCPYVMQINETGAFYWKHLIKGTTAFQLKKELMKEYEISDGSMIEHELMNYLTTLTEKGYILVSKEKPENTQEDD